MINLKIDNIDIRVPQGTTILQAAKTVGIEIPTMCFHNHVENHASCMVCVVKIVNSDEFIPSCEVKVQEGMDILSNSQEVIVARKDALELLLADHIGDCEAPCRNSCPLFLNIPEMNRQIANNQFKEALKIVKEEIALPIVLGYICHAPCEKACRRSEADETISICKLKRFVAEEDLNNQYHYFPEKENNVGKIAIIGAGPSGLSCTYHLLKKGYDCVVYERNSQAGGTLLALQEHEMPAKALKNEIELLQEYGADIRLNTFIDNEKLQSSLVKKYNAIILATGSKTGYNSDFNSGKDKIFECGSHVKQINKVVIAVASGKEAALKAHRFLSERRVQKEVRFFNSKFGKLRDIEIKEYLAEAKNKGENLLDNELEIVTEKAVLEAERCMRCDCRKPYSCKLRKYAHEYNAQQRTYKFNERRTVRKYFKDNVAVYEPGKCIKCGLCIKVAEKHKEKIGLTYIGRGFDITVDIPFNKNLDEALVEAAAACIDVCPTGALAHYKGEI